MYKLLRGLEGPRRKHEGSPLQVARAVFWSFFGVRRERDLDADAAAITPLQVVIGGIAGTFFFIGLLLGIVKLVLA